MTLAEALTTIFTALGQSGPLDNAYTNMDVQRALRDVGQIVIDMTDCAVTEGTQVVTAGNAEVDLSAITVSASTVSLPAENLLSVELAYIDQGNWSNAGVSYALRDLVLDATGGGGDGNLYICIQAHTSSALNQPSVAGTGYWSKVQWKRGTPVHKANYADVARSLRTGVGGLSCWPWGGADPSDFEVWPPPAFTLPGSPRYLAFRHAALTKGYLYPVPDAAYTLNLMWTAAFTTWTLAETPVPTVDALNIPDRYLAALLWDGVPAWLEVPNPQDRAMAPRWQRFQAEIQRIHGRLARVQSYGGMRRSSMPR